MEHPERKKLPHDVPLWVDPQKDVYYLTVNCFERGRPQLTAPTVAHALVETVLFRQGLGLWFVHLFLVMPDHVHGLFSFPPSKRTVQGVVIDWKRWTNRQLGIEWQRNFFEHRLRNDESAREKADYILANPVRAGLVAKPEEWPHMHIGGVLLRTEHG
jgi:putative transposase